MESKKQLAPLRAQQSQSESGEYSSSSSSCSHSSSSSDEYIYAGEVMRWTQRIREAVHAGGWERFFNSTTETDMELTGVILLW